MNTTGTFRPAPTTIRASAPIPTPTLTPADDAVDRPAHYNNKPVETIDVIRGQLGDDAFVAYCKGNALKYLSRAGAKLDAAEDFAKAGWYARMGAHVVAPDRFKDPRAS